MSSKPVIKLKNINKTFSIKEHGANSIRQAIYNLFKSNKSRDIVALEDINLEVNKGDILGIIGRNGSGKSTLLNIIMGSILPDKGGVVKTKGSIMRLSLGMGIDLNLSARDNIYVNGSVIGLSFKKIGQIFQQIIEFAGLEDFVDTPVKFYSKGMKQRLLFSIAIHANSDIILLDEFFGGTGDLNFKRKSNLAFKEKILEGRTIVIVSHSMARIKKHCTKCIWMKNGRIQMSGTTRRVIKRYEKSVKRRKKVQKSDAE